MFLLILLTHTEVVMRLELALFKSILRQEDQVEVQVPKREAAFPAKTAF